jgi:hypothetical protein
MVTEGAMTYDDIVHGINNILTFNIAHLNRYAAGKSIMIVDPSSVPSTPTT